MVAWDPDQGTREDPRSGAAWAESGTEAVADQICGLRGVAAAVAGRERDAEAATSVLAAKAGGCGGESGSDDGLSTTEGTEFCWGDARVCAGRATDRAAESAGRRAGLHAVYGTAGRIQDLVASLYRTERYMCGEPDRQPAIPGDG